MAFKIDTRLYKRFAKKITGIRKEYQRKLFRKAAKIERMSKGDDKWTKDDYLLY